MKATAVTLAVWVAAATAWAAEISPEEILAQAVQLQVEKGDVKTAAAYFERVATHEQAPPEMKREAARRLVDCLRGLGRQEQAEAVARQFPGLLRPPDNDTGLPAKLQRIVLPVISFEDASIDAVVQYLRTRSKELDPEGQGINFLLRTPRAGWRGWPEGKPPSVTLHLENVPMVELVRYVAQAAGLEQRVEPHAVVFLEPGAAPPVPIQVAVTVALVEVTGDEALPVLGTGYVPAQVLEVLPPERRHEHHAMSAITASGRTVNITRELRYDDPEEKRAQQLGFEVTATVAADHFSVDMDMAWQAMLPPTDAPGPDAARLQVKSRFQLHDGQSAVFRLAGRDDVPGHGLLFLRVGVRLIGPDGMPLRR